MRTLRESEAGGEIKILKQWNEKIVYKKDCFTIFQLVKTGDFLRLSQDDPFEMHKFWWFTSGAQEGS